MPIQKTTEKGLRRFENTACGFLGKNREPMLQNELLQRHQTGRVINRGRPTQDKDFIYGMKYPVDCNGVAKCMNWRYFKKPKNNDSFKRDFIKTNVEAAISGLHTPKEYIDFMKENDFEIKPRRHCMHPKMKFPKDMMFGKLHIPSEPMGWVLGEQYKHDWWSWSMKKNMKRMDELKEMQSRLRRPYDNVASASSTVAYAQVAYSDNSRRVLPAVGN